MPNAWRIHGQDTVACRLDKAELPGWLRKKVVVGPGEGAIVLRDGRSEGMLTQGGDNVQSLLDAAFGWLKGNQDVQVIFVDLSPIRIPIYLGETTKAEEAAKTSATADGWLHAARTSEVSIQALTADKQIINAECIVTLRVDSDDPAALVGLLKNGRTLDRWDLAAIVRDEVLARSLVPHLSTITADQIRGNRDLVSKIGSWARAELDPLLRNHGLIFMDFVVNWGLTEEECLQIEQRRAELTEQARKFGHERRLADMQRDLQIEKARLENAQQLKLSATQGDEVLRDLYLAGGLRRDALIDGRRVDVSKVDAEVRVIQLAIEQKEAALRIETQRAQEQLRLDVEDRQWRQEQEKRLAQLDADDKEMRSLVAMQLQMASAKHERVVATRRMELDADFRRQQTELTARFEERQIRHQEDLARMNQVQTLLSAGMATGAVSADVLKTFLSESTKQSYGTTSDVKAAAMFEAEKSKGNLETFKEAEERERHQQREMARLSAEMMQAAKQIPGPAVVMGAAAPPSPASTVNVAAAAPASSVAARLAALKKLREDGLIDEEELKQRKAAILDEV